MAKYKVLPAKDLPPGNRIVVDIKGISIGVFNVDEEFFALRNSCPHQGAPLCRGKITGTTTADKPFELNYAREGEIIKCPWHGWEFDILTGQSVFNPHKVKVRTYEVTVEGPESDDEDPSIETFPVTVEEGTVYVHV
jgi:nitrite reductase/ring-hydroxylating ferredoxin subunit